MHAPFLLGLIAGGAVIYWFTGASAQAVTTGAYRAVEFIKKNIKLEGSDKASVADSKKVVAICTQYAQKGTLNIFLVVFFSTLAFAFLEPFFFVGYLISIALFGLYQAIFMANAGGAWDNAKKVVETELRAKGTPLHDACVVGDTVGDPFKDTSSVALNPIIKFTTLFGLLAVSLAVDLTQKQGAALTTGLARAVLPDLGCFRVSQLLRNAHRKRQRLTQPAHARKGGTRTRRALTPRAPAIPPAYCNPPRARATLTIGRDENQKSRHHCGGQGPARAPPANPDRPRRDREISPQHPGGACARAP